MATMCGIAGHVAANLSPAVAQTVQTMVDALARRGPDSEGTAQWPGAALGHRRLAILDLSDAGRQPMLDDDGQIAVVFNGCIYNFLELRAELEARGHRFRSRSDTETLLRGYREWGIDELARRLRGMFAFAVWDNPRRTLSLVRDRLGVKPLIYCDRGGEIAFASTVAALRAAGFGGEIDPDAALDVLEFGWVTDHRSMFQGLSKLPPATILEWKDGAAVRREYWTLPAIDESSKISFEEAVEETERLLIESVKLRLIADVPVGVLLSGGIDSTLVCWAMRELGANITAFTVRAPEDPSDESGHATAAARSMGIAHEIVDMPATDFSLDDLVDAFSEPFSCPSAQAMLWVSKAVKQRATVLLTGDGGDDVYLGYPFLWNVWKAQQLARRLPAAAAGALRAAAHMLPAAGPLSRAKNFAGYITGGLADHARAHNGLPYYRNRSMLGERLAGRELPERRMEASLDSARHLLQEYLRYHRKIYFTSEFMPKVDGATMFYAIEARAPFLDHAMWEFAAQLPPEIHLYGGRLKAVLREIARRRVGPDVAFRGKQGFTVPVEEWLADRWSGMLDGLRESTALERDGWIRRGALDAPLAAALGSRSVPVQFWRLLVFERWLQKNSRTPALATPQQQNA